MRSAIVTLTALMLLVVTFTAAAASRPQDEQQDQANRKKQAALTAAEAGADFVLQGEYTGKIAHDEKRVKLGVQVIALGNGNFRTVAYQGGLPGDGWDGEPKTETKSRIENGVLTFKNEKAIGTVKEGVLSIKSAGGNELGKLKKVI